jgi:hypothetical protein
MPGMPPGAEGMPPGAELGGPGMDPNTMAGALAEESGMLPATSGAPGMPPGMPGMPGMPPGAPAVPGGFGQMSDPSEMLFKDDLFEKDTDLARWIEILDRRLERLFERQQRVVLEKVAGQKSRKLLMSGGLDVDTVMPIDTWNKQMDEDIKPVLSAIIKDAQAIYSTKSASYSSPGQNDILTHIESQMERIKSRNNETQRLISEAIYNSYGIRDEEQRASGVRSNLNSIFTEILAKRRPDMAINEARRAWNFPRPL